MQDKAVQIIREELGKRGLNAVKIILFGSKARGDFGPDSDWDFLVVVDKDYNVPIKLDNTLRWIFYKKYVRFLNENVFENSTRSTL